jgi:hypothetical protein
VPWLFEFGFLCLTLSDARNQFNPKAMGYPPKFPGVNFHDMTSMQQPKPHGVTDAV